jgi:hypothetical protein
MEDDKLIEFVDSLNLPFEGELKYGKEYYVEVSLVISYMGEIVFMTKYDQK